MFDGEKAYFISNGGDDFGDHGITQCEIDIDTGKKLTQSKTIWHGSGGRYLESPHMYKIGNYFYLMAAEGGTEYGHMITYARSDDPWGTFAGYDKNPVLTNRNRGASEIQGVGHGDLVQSPNGEWFVIHLGFRQIRQFEMYHHLGREVFMTPVHFNDEGWFSCGKDGTTDAEYEISGNAVQQSLPEYTLKNIDREKELLFLRDKNYENYDLDEERYILKGTELTIDDIGSPTFAGIRQRDMNGVLECSLKLDGGEAGISAYMDEAHHYDIKLREKDGRYEAVLTLNIGNIKHDQKIIPLNENKAELKITFDSHTYNFSVNGEYMGNASTRYLSSEVAGGFTGVLFAVFAQKGGIGEFSGFRLAYQE